MHTRRFGAFITGMWLMGAIMMWFIASQSDMNVERLFSTPPPQLQKEINDMGSDVARQVFRYQASALVRRVQETWDVIQLGLLGALLATSVLTAHRSRVVVIATVVMIVCVLVQAFYLTPLMNGLGRAFDFLPQTAAVRERDAYGSYQTLSRALDVIKLLLALGIVSRLLFDFYDFGSAVLPWSKPSSKRRRRTRRSSAYGGSRSSSSTSPSAAPDAPASPEETRPDAAVTDTRPAHESE